MYAVARGEARSVQAKGNPQGDEETLGFGQLTVGIQPLPPNSQREKILEAIEKGRNFPFPDPTVL